MPHTRCSVRDCDVNSKILARTGDKSIKFHQFPKNEAAFSQWIKACKCTHLPHLERYPYCRGYYHVCSRHFHPVMYTSNGKLKKDAFPTENLPPEKPVQLAVSFIHSRKQGNHSKKEIKDNDVTQAQGPEKMIKIEKMLQQSLDDSISKAFERNKQRKEKAENLYRINKKPKRIDPHLSKISGMAPVSIHNTDVPESDITLAQFLKGCDKFLLPDISTLVKSSITVNCTKTSTPSTSELSKDSIQTVTKKIKKEL